MPNIGLPELAIILVIVLLLFGATRLPKLGKSMGQGIKGFKEGLNEATSDSAPETEQPKEIDKAASTDGSDVTPPTA
jgi:sec-independent protein translocase protein TatA